MTPAPRIILAVALSLAILPAFAEKPADWHESQEAFDALQTWGTVAELPRGLSHCVAYRESRFKANARSKLVGEFRSCGIMQLYRKYIVANVARFSSHPESFQWDNPSDNAEVGCKYLAYLIKKFDGSVYLGVLAYNYGETNLRNVKNWSDIPKHCLGYTDDIMLLLDEWQEDWR